jgi:hypothetical protein
MEMEWKASAASMKHLTCDLCNSDERVLTYTVGGKCIYQKISQIMNDGVPYSPPQAIEICNKCADEINVSYKNLIEKFGLQNYSVLTT